ncbi:MAG TPA: NAD(P)/FAD-dependent oxidoreductase [Acidimicrobiales bacterium]|nr:NAD(P)/FAD-dependent oxidoreductase [Acidimicrobiales bacterium]
MTDVVVVGSGFAGLAMAARLRGAGVSDFVVLERADEVGGTWRDNTYPGATCDVPSHLYSFSFRANPGWTYSFSRQAEIQAYLRRCADELGVRPHLRLGHEMLGADWDERRCLWVVSTTGGVFEATHLVSATGALSDPATPALPGLDRFAGTVFHSARWDHGADLAGRNVAVIGTGASAVQFVPEIQPVVGRLSVYQRTAPWVVPRRDRRMGRRERSAYARWPALQRLVRGSISWAREGFVAGFHHPAALRAVEGVARRHLRRQVPDPALRGALTPAYTIGCKRILLSNDYYPALCRPNVELVTDGIAEVREHSMVTVDGTERPVDTVIFATGFHVTDLPAASRIRGRDGVVLRDAWAAGMEAYKGTTVAGFPNLWFVVGPNTGLGHTSMVIMIEAQAGYVGDALRQMRRRGLRTAEVRVAAQDRYNAAVQRRLATTVWSVGGCSSWYLDERGRNTTLWPGTTWSFRRRTHRFDPGAYDLGAPVTPAGPAVPPARVPDQDPVPVV